MEKILPLLRKNARTSTADLARARTSVKTRLPAASPTRSHRRDPRLSGDSRSEKVAGERVTAVIEVKITPERDGGFNKLAERIAKISGKC